MPKKPRFWAKIVTSAIFLSIQPTPKIWAFTDTGNHWGKNCITTLRGQNLLSGYPDGTFRPQATITRAEFAVVMLNTFPTAEAKRSPISFKDVPANHWAYRAIRDAYAREFFSGYPDGTFQPSQAIPRVQALAVMANALGLSRPENAAGLLRQYFDDATQVPGYAIEAIGAATVGRLAVNYPQIRQLRPNQSSTRGEVAALMCQGLNLPRTVPVEYIGGNQDLFAIPPEMGGIGQFSEGLATAKIGDKWGYIDKNGALAIPPQFDNVTDFAAGLAAVEIGGKWGYIDKNGQQVIPPQFSLPVGFSEDLANFQIGNKFGYIDKTGQWAIELAYPGATAYETWPFSEGLAQVRIDFDKTGFIDKTGKFVIEPQPYIAAYKFSQGLAWFRPITGKAGYMDKTGAVVIPPQFDETRDFKDGLAAVKIGNKWGFIDQTGKFIIPPQFFAVQDFAEGMAAVNIDDKWGYIDKTGAIVIPPQFSAPPRSGLNGAASFSEGLAMVRLGEKAGFIDKTGKFVISPQFADAFSFSNGLAKVNVGGAWVEKISGYTHNTGADYITGLEGGKWGYIAVPPP